MVSPPRTLQVPTTMPSSSYTFDAPDADVIVRAPLQQGSKELKDFHVHKAILSIASTLFRDLFSIPQPPQPSESDTTLPIVQIAESAGVFEVFLRLIYPIEPPVIDSLQLILFSPSFLENDPILVYAIACRANLDEEARLAIPYTFGTDLVQDISPDKLRMMTVESYHHLLVEHSLRRDQLINAADEVHKSLAPWGGGCHCLVQLKKEMRLQLSSKPFLNRELFEKYLSSAQAPFPQCDRCILSPKKNSGFFALLMRKVHGV